MQLVRTELVTLVQHPMDPDAHALQFFPRGTKPEILAESKKFFANTGWNQRVDERGQLVAEAAHAIALFLEKMKDCPNNVWLPSVKGVPTSNMQVHEVWVSWHTLDTLVWSWAECDDAPDCSFADLYFYYARCQILAHVRPHAKHSSNARGRSSLSERNRGGGKGKGKGKDEGKGTQKPR